LGGSWYEAGDEELRTIRLAAAIVVLMMLVHRGGSVSSGDSVVGSAALSHLARVGRRWDGYVVDVSTFCGATAKARTENWCT
jgi:hypothetical protein